MQFKRFRVTSMFPAEGRTDHTEFVASSPEHAAYLAGVNVGLDSSASASSVAVEETDGEWVELTV